MSEEKRVWGIHTLDDNLFLNKNKFSLMTEWSLESFR